MGGLAVRRQLSSLPTSGGFPLKPLVTRTIHFESFGTLARRARDPAYLARLRRAHHTLRQKAVLWARPDGPLNVFPPNRDLGLRRDR